MQCAVSPEKGEEVGEKVVESKQGETKGQQSPGISLPADGPDQIKSQSSRKGRKRKGEVKESQMGKKRPPSRDFNKGGEGRG